MKTIRLHLTGFITLLLLTGITALPLIAEIDFLYAHRAIFSITLTQWIEQLYRNIHQTPTVMLYGTDWLAFAHIVIGLFFIPVYHNPLQYRANMLVGMAACLLIFPLAFICGPIRDIPFFHQLIDCSFGVLGFLYLYYILKKINRLKNNVYETPNKNN